MRRLLKISLACIVSALLITGMVWASDRPLIEDKDISHLTFGLTLRAEEYPDVNHQNPHMVASHSVFLCKEGRQQEVISTFGDVEQDKDLGRAFRTFIEVFAENLEKYKGKRVYLQFVGYAVNKPTTVWYYYIVDQEGRLLDSKPWVSLHRSRANQLCALTGIFIINPEMGDTEEDIAMPTSLIKSLKSIMDAQ